MSGLKSMIGRLAGKIAPDLRFRQQAFSSEGEDLVLKRIFGDKSGGVYVDVGAHHPFRYSNTYLFYKSNWWGINIEPMPGSKSLFDRYRPTDINLEMAVSATRQQLSYYIFNDAALNTFSKDKVAEYSGERYRVIAEKKIETWPLADILDRYLETGTIIDFMTIDAEGLDMDVLRSNNWRRYRPRFVLVESQPLDDRGIDNNELCRFMQQQGYMFFAKTYYTYFFKNMQDGYD